MSGARPTIDRASVSRCVVLCLALSTAWCEAQRTVVVGGEDGYAPYETLGSSGAPEGFNVDLMRAIADAEGFEVAFDLGDWVSRREAMERGDIDVLGMFVSEERERIVDFAPSHIIVFHRIFVRAGSPPLDSVRDFEGRSVVVQRDAYSHEHLARLDLVGTELVLVDDERIALRRLASGEVDAALLTEHRSRRILSEEGIEGLTVTGAPVLPAPYAFAVSEGDDELLAALTTGLDRVRSDGTFDVVYARWLGHDEDAAPEASSPPSRAPWIAAGLAAVAALAAIVPLRLRRSRLVAARTLDHLRRYDALTGALNREAFATILASHATTEASLAVVRVDRLRLVNESFGHVQGDEVLRRVVALARAGLDDGEAIARIGGDEFAVLLERTASDALGWAEERLAEVRGARFGTPEHPCWVTISVGIATGLPGDANDLAGLLSQAEVACDASRQDGGDRARTWRSDDANLSDRRGQLRWIRELPSALDEGRVVPHWQPIVATVSARKAKPSIELLARMRSADGELVPAGLFFGAAERYGLAERIDRRMLQTALAWAEEHPELLGRLDRLHLNLSGKSLGDPRFLGELETLPRTHGALLPRLCFEVTETALIANLDAAHATLAMLREHGSIVALDDFGVGLASMSYLRRLPVDLLKIDGSFVRDLGRNPTAEPLIRHVHRLGHAMGLRTVAEFVESDAARDRLAHIGVDAVQGYAIGRADAMDSLPSWLERFEARPAQVV